MAFDHACRPTMDRIASGVTDMLVAFASTVGFGAEQAVRADHGAEMVLVPAGEFWMGSDDGNDDLVAAYGQDRAAGKSLDVSTTLRYRSAPQVGGGCDDETPTTAAVPEAQATRQSRGHGHHEHGAAERTAPASADRRTRSELDTRPGRPRGAR